MILDFAETSDVGGIARSSEFDDAGLQTCAPARAASASVFTPFRIDFVLSMTDFTQRIARGTLLVALLAVFTALPAQAQLGIAGGLNFESSDDISTGSANANFENSTGYHIGIVYDLGAGPVSIRPGVFYRKVGTYDFGNVTGGSGSVDISTIEVPVDVRLNLLVTPIIKPYALAGPMISFPRESFNGFNPDDDEGFTSDATLSANVGAGVELSLPAVPFKLQPELRYEFGISSYVDTDTDLVEVSDEPKFSAFSLRVNVIF